MSDADVAPVPDAPVPGRTFLVPQGETDPWPAFLWRWFARGWRPFGGWMLDLILLRTAVVPLWQIVHGLPVEPVDWVPLTAFGATLIVARSYDKKEGTS